MTPPVPEPGEGLNAAVAAELRAEMGRQKISVAALAERSGVKYGSLRRYLNAERHIDLAVLGELAEALEVSVAHIVTAAGSSKTENLLQMTKREHDKLKSPWSFDEAEAARDEDRGRPRMGDD